MIFMTAFWVILGAGLAVYAIAKKYAKSSNADDFATAALLLAAAFLVVGIAKNDPLFAQFGVPAEYEWIVGLFITGMVSWKLYFNPLKRKVYSMDREIGELKTDVSAVKSDVHMMRTDIMKIREKIVG